MNTTVSADAPTVDPSAVIPVRPLADRVPDTADADAVFEALHGWVDERGLSLYPHQEEAIIELLSGSNAVLATPTGSGKSLVATAAIFAALAGDRVAFYTAPIKALVSEKFFEMCAVFGPENVGMLTGDAAVNADAPVICCTAEVLANLALREGRQADVGLVVMDEFHYYGEPERGWAWQVPLLELPQAQFLLMSATLGDVGEIRADLTRRTARATALIDDAERPVPLTFTWATTPLPETIEELISTHQVPAYVVHFTQAAAVEHANSLITAKVVTREEKDRIAEKIGSFRFAAGFGRSLSRMLRNGIGVHHAGMLPRYRRLVEQLAQAGLLKIICGTDTLGVGINVPIRTVVFTGLTKFDGSRMRLIRVREFQQIAGRAGRAGFDTAGSVVVQAPEHVIENERALAKAGDDPKKRRKVQRRKAPDGVPVWTEESFRKLVEGSPEPLTSRMRVDNSMLLNVVARHEDAFAVMRRLLQDNHESRRNQLSLSRRALRLARSLVRSGVLRRLDDPDQHGRRYVLTEDLPADFALNQPLSHFALAALDLLDPESDDHTLDVVSVTESVLEAPRQLLMAQQFVARGEAVAEMKADGLEYEERMARLEEVTWPQPLAEVLEPAFETYRETHPWLPPDALSPKSIVRQMYTQAWTFHDFIKVHNLARGEGLLLRYLSDAYRALRHSVPSAFRGEEFEDLLEWLAETVRQVDSSLLDEWEALADPDATHRVAAREEADQHARSSRPISAQTRAFTVMVRNALFRRVEHVAFDRVDALAQMEQQAAQRCDPVRTPLMTRDDWDRALEAYFGEHDDVVLDADARSRARLLIEEATGSAPGTEDGGDDTESVRLWQVRQTISDPAGHHDWVIDAVVDLDASDAVAEAVVFASSMRCL